MISPETPIRKVKPDSLYVGYKSFFLFYRSDFSPTLETVGQILGLEVAWEQALLFG